MSGEDMVVRRERLLMRVPGWGRILKGSYVARFAKTFSTLLESGVRVLPALQYAGQATGSRLFADSATEMRREVEHGARIGESMRRTGVFPPLVCELASAGENSGSLPEMMAKAAAFYESDVSRMLDSLSSLIEPVLIVIVGAIVCVLGLAVFGPIMEAVNNPM
ncbi:MAG TPA: hypothetical protein GXX40_09530 [Firmicutes bacterium]|nr:hypothetical protein [Bacillota bacterium]